MLAKVWLGGEGTCELGGRADDSDRPGVIEKLLLRIEPSGWHIVGARQWKYIRKYRARAALDRGENHGDIRNVLGLALEASENACEVLAFVRDTDADTERADALAVGIHQATTLFTTIRIIGGPAKPAIEGWILALVGVGRTDEMSRARTLTELAAKQIDEKSPEAYVEVVDAADLETLPHGCESLVNWLTLGRAVRAQVIRGTPPTRDGG